MSEYLDRLKNLTEKLPSFPDIIERHLTKNGKIEQYYEMDEGNCYAVYLHRSGDDIAVHRWFNSKGGKFPKHNHNEKEWIVIYKGSMILHDFRGDHTLKKGDCYYSLPNMHHWAEFPEDCKYITITMPAAKEYPNGY
jgi:quercetin dioxygenase-like cupin family protein